MLLPSAARVSVAENDGSGGGKPFPARLYPLPSFNLSHFLGCIAKITQFFAGCMELRESAVDLGLRPVTDEMRNYLIMFLN